MQKFICSAFICLSLIAFSACGFKPMASKKTDAMIGNHALRHAMASVRIHANTTNDLNLTGQHFRIELEDLINPGERLSDEIKYQLNVNLTRQTIPGFVAPDGKAQRFLVDLRSEFELIDLASGRVIERGKLKRSSSYSNRPNAYFSTYVAEQDTLKRLAGELAEEYRMKLASLLKAPPVEPTMQIDQKENYIPNLPDPNTATPIPGFGS